MSSLDHPNILDLVGITINPLQLLLEYAPERDLKYHLKRYRTSNILPGLRVSLQLMKQVCRFIIHTYNAVKYALMRENYSTKSDN